MLCVFGLHESRGQPGANCVRQAEERQPTANVRVDSSPHLFSFSLGSLGHQDMGNKPPEAAHLDSRSLLFRQQEELKSRCRGHVCPQPKSTCCWLWQPATTVIVSMFLAEGAVFTSCGTWRSFYQSALQLSSVQQAEPKRVCVIKTTG